MQEESTKLRPSPEVRSESKIMRGLWSRMAGRTMVLSLVSEREGSKEGFGGK